MYLRLSSLPNPYLRFCHNPTMYVLTPTKSGITCF